MPQDIYDKILTLAKRRGYIYPSFEIYGGVAGFYDYGPLGSQLKNNIENLWRKYYLFVDGCVEISTPTITLFEVLQASGHVDEFTDLTVDCPTCKRSYKVADILQDGCRVEDAVKKNMLICPGCKKKLTDPHPVNLMFSTSIGVGDSRKAFLRPETAQGIFTNFHLLYRYHREKLPFGVVQVGRGYRNEISPRQGTLRQREFSMAEAEIFFDPLCKKHPRFDLVKEKKIKLFDNEKEYMLSLQDAVQKKIIHNQALAYYMYLTQEFLVDVGVDINRFRFRKHAADELAHYATECWDAELFSERFGWVECVGIADRSAYDLNAHIVASSVDMYAVRKFDQPQERLVKKIVPKMNVLGPLFKDKAAAVKQALEALDVETSKKVQIVLDGKKIDIPDHCFDVVEVQERVVGEKFIPHVIEPSYGIDRIVYFVLEHSYREVTKNDEDYRILQLRPHIAPIKVGVFPLTTDETLVMLAQQVECSLRQQGISTFYDEAGTIGRRYARMDEIGTPLCVTIDHESLSHNTVTVRDRDTTKQERVAIENLVAFLNSKIGCSQ
ncbi:MAG: glycine--tRNA ligase [Candidatus Thermoplasmatota archaeon]